MSTMDLDHVMQQEAVPMTSQACQLTQDQSVAVCKQLQQVSSYQVYSSTYPQWYCSIFNFFYKLSYYPAMSHHSCSLPNYVIKH